MTEAYPRLPAPSLEHVADVSAELGPPVDVGQTPLGRRRLIPILAGTLRGPELSGRILPGGADFQLVSTPTQLNLHARYVIETDRGELLYVENTGMRVASELVSERLLRGEPVAPSEVYFRTSPRFETAAPRLTWMMSSLFIGSGVRSPHAVELSFYRVS